MTHDESTLAYVQHLHAPARREHAFVGRSADDVAAWPATARPALRGLIGLDRIAADGDGFESSVALGEAEDLGEYTRRRGVLHAEPAVDVPLWFLRPKGDGPFPIGVFPHGHYGENGLDYAAGVASSDAMRAKIEREDRDVAVQAVRRGFVAIAPATRGFHPAGIPDVTGRHDGRDCRSHLIHALLAGRTVIGERVWDVMRLIDWAGARDETDASTVLVMGNSGGGVVTLYAAACDERVTVAVSSCAFCTFVGAGGVVHHCDCNTVPGIGRFGDFDDVAGLIAPRRLLVVHGRTDELFPPAEIDCAVEGVRRCYAAAGAPGAFQHRWGAEGHRFYSDLMWPFVTDRTSR
ncbi:MAG: alpha/beta hydrolase family protein [Planctomycetota bacterium]